jgi:hypothetical protein
MGTGSHFWLPWMTQEKRERDAGTRNHELAASDVRRALEHVIQFDLSVVFGLRKTATKPTEFSGRNTTTSLYKLKRVRGVSAADFGWFGRCFTLPEHLA